MHECAKSLRRFIRAVGFLIGMHSAVLGGEGSPSAPPQDPPLQEDAAAGSRTIDLQFFESRIRPVLIEHCYSCHSAEAAAKNALRGGLRVDDREAMIAGGESGPAIVPGVPQESLLLSALRQESFAMPPEGPLSPQTIADFEEWIARGAAAPREVAASTNPSLPKRIDIQAAREHWAYRSLPAIVPGTIDGWIEAGLSQIGVPAAPRENRYALARRLHLDLTGLPPDVEQLRMFVADPSPRAYEKMVDRLLASPEYGERWGRHWLDVVRFAESVTLRGLVQHQAWRYRDYVITSFNEDLPYDRFLIEQIAGDLLAADSIAAAQRQHIATTFLTLGNLNLEEQDKAKLRMDAVDEQLTVIGSALLAQTIGCARCHDHKFDPISARDYYAMAGILHNTRLLEHENVSRWIERPLPITPAEQAEIDRDQARLRDLKSELGAIRERLAPAPRDAKAVPPTSLAGIVVDNRAATLVGAWTPSTSSPRFVGDAYLHDGNTERGKKSAHFQIEIPETGDYEVRISYSPGENRSRAVQIAVQDFVDTHPRTINQRETPPIDGLFVSLGKFHFSASQSASIFISNLDTDGHTIVDAVQLLPVDAEGGLERSSFLAANPSQELDPQQRAAVEAEAQRLQQELDQFSIRAARVPQYQGVEEEEKIADLPLQIRGNVHHHGPVIPRGFLQIVSAELPAPLPEHQSGRVELARWIAAAENPLTARVYANRLWGWLLGAGLSRTADNFGLTGSPPTHPELLDLLARRMIDQGWSTKSLVREIVLSETYQQSSSAAAEVLAHDPENQRWTRAMRKPIAAESLVDSILVTSGELDRAMGGSLIPEKLSADYDHDPTSHRRAIYWPALRNSIAEPVRTFDGADPSFVTGTRWSSAIAPQALLMLNHPWIIAQSRLAAERLLALPLADPQARLDYLGLQILSRPLRDAERLALEEYLYTHGVGATAGDAAEGAEATEELVQVWSEVIQALFATVDFRYGD